MDQFIEDIQTASLVVIPSQQAEHVVPHDPNDDPVVQTAVLGQAEVLSTRDRHLHTAEVVAYCRDRGIVVLNDLELLAHLRR